MQPKIHTYIHTYIKFKKKDGGKSVNMSIHLTNTVIFEPHNSFNLFLYFDVVEFFFKFIYLFIYYFWLCWVFVATCRLSLCGEHGLLFVVVHGLLLLRSMGSRLMGFNSCGTRAQ